MYTMKSIESGFSSTLTDVGCEFVLVILLPFDYKFSGWCNAEAGTPDPLVFIKESL